MDPQTLYRTGSPALGGPVLLELRYRVVSLDPTFDSTAVPILVLSDLACAEAWVLTPGTWAWLRALWYRLGVHLRRIAPILRRSARRAN